MASTERAVDALWRPDGARSTVHTWDMHLEGMRPVDRAICFNIAADPRVPYIDDGGLIYSAEQATKCALDAIQLLGGNGYINDYATGRLLRDAKLYEIGAGTSEIRRMLIGRELFEKMR